VVRGSSRQRGTECQAYVAVCEAVDCLVEEVNVVVERTHD
jgi:hypothetical protein